jgi:hypothetical protein
VNLCSYSGVCRNFKCYCIPGFTESDCSKSIEDAINKGMPFESIKFYLIGAAVFGIIVGIIILNYIANKIGAREFVRLNRNSL